MSCKLEPAIWSHDTGQQISCFDRCQLIITWCPISKKYRVNLGFMSVNLIFGVWPPCCATPSPPSLSSPGRTCPQAMPLATITMRKSTHGFPFLSYSQFLLVMWWKLKIVTIEWVKSRIWDSIDDWYLNKLAKNQVFAVFYSHVICRSVSPKFIGLCMETPCLCPSEGHKYGGCKVTETPVTEFCY